MKYITHFEQIEYKYKVGDYVLLDDELIGEYDLDNIHVEEPLNIDYSGAKIYKVNTTGNVEEKFVFQYVILLYNDQTTNVREEEIIRLLTPDEIKEFETKKETLKYNI